MFLLFTPRLFIIMTRTRIAKPRVLRIKIPLRPSNASQPVPAPSAPPKSTAEPLQVVELLELILLNLPMRELLLSQRVCRRWKDVITGSQALQRALYFLPEPDVECHSPSFTGKPISSYFRPNRLLEDAFWNQFDIPPVSDESCIPHQKLRCYCSATVRLRTFAAEWHESMKYEEASWRRMLITQPPVCSVSVDSCFRIAPDYDDCWMDSWQERDGVRLGHMLILD